MVLAELETLARLDLPVVVVVFNDSALSLIAVKQQPTDHGGSAVVTYAPTDFATIAKACGIRSWSVSDPEDFRTTLAEAIELGKPCLIDVMVDPRPYADVYAALRE